MPRAIRPHDVLHRLAGPYVSFPIALALAFCMALPAEAASITAKDALIIAKALGFLEPAPAGGLVAVLYGPGAASKANANKIAGLFGGGLKSGGGTVTAKPVDAAGLGDGSGFIAVIVAEGGPTDAAMAAAKAQKILCVTLSVAEVQAGQCVMSVQTDPEVVITVNRSLAQAVGVHFAAALAMLIHEI